MNNTELVKNIQQFLTDNGLYSGKIDGVDDAATREGYKLWLASNNIPANQCAFPENENSLPQGMIFNKEESEDEDDDGEKENKLKQIELEEQQAKEKAQKEKEAQKKAEQDAKERKFNVSRFLRKADKK